MPRYRLYGLTVESEVALDEPELDGDSQVDVHVVRGGPRPSVVGPDGTGALAHVWIAGNHSYELRQEPRGLRLAFGGAGSFSVSPTLDAVVAHGDPQQGEALLPVLVSGNVLDVLLTLRGHHVLHASAVDADGGATAIVGQPGRGKSTLAALLAPASRGLVTDDLLRVDLSSRGVVCFRGSSRVRLRPNAWSLADAGLVAPTADGRRALRLVATDRDELPLARVIVPMLSRDDTALRVRRLSNQDAFRALGAFPRLSGWRAPDVLQRQFLACAELAGRVPVFLAHVPWGPPFAEDLGADLLEALRAS